MREPERQTFYLVGTPKGKINQHEKKWLDLPWQKVRDSVEVKLYEHEGELYVLAKSEGRQAKEIAMRRKRLARLLRKLRAMRRSLPEARPVAAAHRRRQEGSRPGFRVREDSDAASGPSGHARDVLVSGGQGQAQSAPNNATATICCAAISLAKIRRCCGRAMCN